jgi:hypothetical protein
MNVTYQWTEGGGFMGYGIKNTNALYNLAGLLYLSANKTVKLVLAKPLKE